VRPDVVKPPAQSGVMSMRKVRLACFAAIVVLAGATQAFAERTFPVQAKRGDLQAYQYPSMKIGNKVYKLSPGSRIFNQQNLIITPASLQLQRAPVMYLLDMSGDISRIWLLTGEEATRLPVFK
jgi:hypothetical protein